MFKKFVLNPIVTTIKYLKSSKTLIFNASLAMVGAIDMYSSTLRELFSTPQSFAVFMIIIATVGSMLRFVTTTSVKEKVEKKEKEEL